MKKLFLILMVVAVPFLVFAQQNSYKDVVKLKNGSIIKEIIIEQVPNQQIKIQTADGSIFVYQMKEISKLKKEMVKNEKIQDNNSSDKGYIGLSLGMSIPMGDASDGPNGFVLSLIDFGYRFSSNIGVAGKWFGMAYSEDSATASIGGLMAGGLGVYPISEKAEFISRVLIGFGKGQVKYQGETIEGDLEFAYDLGVEMKFNVGRKIAILTNIDYIGVKDFKSLNLTAGIAYRF